MIRTDIFFATKQPVALLSIHIISANHMRRAKFAPPNPAEVYLPRASTLRPPNVFTDFHTCLLNRILARRAWLPTKCISMKNESSQSTSTGREFRYDGNFRPTPPPPPTGVSDKSHSKPGKVPVRQKRTSAETTALSDTALRAECGNSEGRLIAP